jgi:ribonucleoside-triphosphate reductase
MRIGLGVTGVCQSLDKLDWLDQCYRELRQFDREWSKQKGWPESIKLTTIKPSGTLSILAGATPGVHPGFSQYHIRRIRMSSNDGLVKMCRDLGYEVEYLKNFDGSEDHGTVVVSFPCEFDGSTMFAKNMPAITQLELVKKLQTVWADNSISVTVYYRREELEEIKAWLKKNYKKGVKSVSFLLHSDHGFAQAPYEEITETRYRQLAKKLKPITAGITRIDQGTLEDLECSSGACPIK